MHARKVTLSPFWTFLDLDVPGTSLGFPRPSHKSLDTHWASGIISRDFLVLSQKTLDPAPHPAPPVTLSLI